MSKSSIIALSILGGVSAMFVTLFTFASLVGEQSLAGLGLGIIWSLVLWLFAIPTVVAALRQMPNVGPIALVNFLTGWTVIGWIAALVMACITRPAPVQVQA